MAIVDVVKYNGTPDVFAWKYPNEELGTWTQLIVNEAQEAVLVKGGQVLDVFGSGRHTLDTANIPLLNNIVNLPFGDKSPFSAEIWYINKAYNLDVKWGTSSPIQLQDPKYGIFAPVRANGIFGIRIEDSKKFLIKLVGTMPIFDKDSLTKYFRGVYIAKVKDSISSYLVQEKISILEINAYIDELSNYLQEKVGPTLDDYGIGLVSFYVNEISVPEEDPAVKKLKDALAKRAEMDIIGYDYRQERSFDTLEGAANNNGGMVSPLMGAGMGMGIGFGMGGPMGAQFGNMAKEMSTEQSKKCPQCHVQIPMSQRFCGNCGFDTKDSEPDTPKETKLSCSSCDAQITETTKFCPNCGRKIKHCPNCGNDIPEGETVCSFCGDVLPMPCPGCGKPISSQAKFCPECGEKLAKNCPKCNAAITGTPKFCPECGEKF